MAIPKANPKLVAVTKHLVAWATAPYAGAECHQTGEKTLALRDLVNILRA
jgi:hypothetical protein